MRAWMVVGLGVAFSFCMMAGCGPKNPRPRIATARIVTAAILKYGGRNLAQPSIGVS